MLSFCPDCNTHEYQDKRYGINIRVVNETTKLHPTQYRCTVCGKESPIKQKPSDWFPTNKK